jgi:hypothetical protein
MAQPTNYSIITTTAPASDYQQAGENLSRAVQAFIAVPANGGCELVGGACFNVTPDGQYVGCQAMAWYVFKGKKLLGAS